ncbi:hypothetical protein IJF81_01935 [bacterium]|nr:hypothetical protein [bacterium]
MKQDIIKIIENKEIQLAKLKEHVDKSTICSDLYNKLVIEKAILKKEYENNKKSKIIHNLKKFIPKRERLICDYFSK